MSQTTYRQTKRLPVDLFVNKFMGDEPFACRTRDLSAEGAYLLKLIEPLRNEEDDVVGLEFTLPGSSEVIWATGQVIRDESKPGKEGVAVKFVAMADRHKKMLRDFVEDAEGWVVTGPKLT